MFENTRDLIENLLAPMVSVQIFLAILIYFTIVRKNIADDYKLYVCFLVTLIFFLGGRSIQEMMDWPNGSIILYTRMSLLFSIGIPSLLVAASKQSGQKRSWKWYSWPYLIGFSISLGYVVSIDVSLQQIFFKQEMFTWLPFKITTRIGHKIQILGAVLMLVIPCSSLMINEFKKNRDLKLLAFLFGVFLFGVFIIIGTLTRSFGIYYMGSVLSALFWCWAVFQDIREMRSEVNVLKEDLHLVVRSGHGKKNLPEVDRLLNRLEDLSQGNLDIYKIRIREILNMLTDTTIQAGGDTKDLIRRNTQLGSEIEGSEDTESIRGMIRSEVVELSGMIAEIPEKKRNESIGKAISNLESNFSVNQSVEELAESVGLSRSHFMREFKKETGLTVMQYLTAYRIKHAKLLLVEKSVTDTAFEVGYNNSNYFSTVFKKQTGMSPIDFQQKLKN